MTDTERRILQYVARTSESKPYAPGGWVVYAVPVRTDGSQAWEWDAYKPLVERGLLNRGEDWKNIYLRLTDAGWRALSKTKVG
jgi:hypothetical protein